MQPTPLLPVNNQTPEQAFLVRTTTRMPRPQPGDIFRTPRRICSASCGPLWARHHARLDSSTLGRRAGALTSTLPILGRPPSTTQHGASQNFLKWLSNPKDRAVRPVVSPGAGSIAVTSASPDCSGKKAPRSLSGGVGAGQVGGGLQTHPDAGSGTEKG